MNTKPLILAATLMGGFGLPWLSSVARADDAAETKRPLDELVADRNPFMASDSSDSVDSPLVFYGSVSTSEGTKLGFYDTITRVSYWVLSDHKTPQREQGNPIPGIEKFDPASPDRVVVLYGEGAALRYNLTLNTARIVVQAAPAAPAAATAVAGVNPAAVTALAQALQQAQAAPAGLAGGAAAAPAARGGRAGGAAGGGGRGGGGGGGGGGGAGGGRGGG